MIESIRDSLYIAWTIAAKDIRDALTNRATRTNILVIIGLVLFFYWMSTLRPFDKRVEVVVYNQGGSNLNMSRATLQDGTELEFRSVNSFDDLEQKMAYKDLGLVVPDGFEQNLETTLEADLVGYIHWANRNKVAELEMKYSAMFTELLGNPVQVEIGDNILIPPSNSLGMASTASFHVFFAILWTALTVVPFLIMEERKAKTMEALLVSPASPGQVVLGKALAGLIFVMAIAGFSLALNGIYVTLWGWALLGFLVSALFAIGLSLLLGSVIRSGQQITLWMLPVILVILLPALFADEPNLVEGLKAILIWSPGNALAQIQSFSMTTEIPIDLIVQNLAIAIISIVLVYAVVIWQVYRSDR